MEVNLKTKLATSPGLLRFVEMRRYCFREKIIIVLPGVFNRCGDPEEGAISRIGLGDGRR
jgi:hypothetical protein